MIRTHQNPVLSTVHIALPIRADDDEDAKSL